MSIQDDYFDLSESDNLSEHNKAALERIWNHMIDMENEAERLRPIVNKFRDAISSLFEDTNESK